MGYPLEMKHVGGFEPLEVIVERYMPQVQWQMFVTGAQKAVLSVIMGAREPITETIPRNDEYIAEMVKRASYFMDCVRRRVPPVELPEVPAPIDPTIVHKSYDLTSNNLWASLASDWLASKDAAETAKAAEKALKEIVPADAKKCTGAGVRVTRDRAGRLSLRVDEVKT